MNVAPLPHDLFGGASATDGTYLYVFGGYSFTSAQTLNTLYRYNPTTDTWTTLAPMPVGTLMSAAVYYQRVYYGYPMSAEAAQAEVRPA